MNQWSDSTALPRTHPHTHNTQPKGTQTDENVQSVCYDVLTYVNVQWRVVYLSLSHHLSLCHLFRFCCRGNRVNEERRMHLERWEARQRVRERKGEGPTNGTGEKNKIFCVFGSNWCHDGGLRWAGVVWNVPVPLSLMESPKQSSDSVQLYFKVHLFTAWYKIIIITFRHDIHGGQEVISFAHSAENNIIFHMLYMQIQ